MQPVIEFSLVSVPQCLKKFPIYTVGVIKKLSEEGGQSIARNLIWKSGCRVLRTYSYDMRRKKGWHSKMYESFLKDLFNKLHSSLVTACTETFYIFFFCEAMYSMSKINKLYIIYR